MMRLYSSSASPLFLSSLPFPSKKPLNKLLRCSIHSGSTASDASKTSHNYHRWIREGSVVRDFINKKVFSRIQQDLNLTDHEIIHLCIIAEKRYSRSPKPLIMIESIGSKDETPSHSNSYLRVLSKTAFQRAIVLSELLDAPIVPGEFADDLFHGPLGLSHDVVLIVNERTVNVHRIGGLIIDREPHPKVFLDFTRTNHQLWSQLDKKSTELRRAFSFSFKKPEELFVLDSTAGLGRDSFLMAHLGCKTVLMVERNPIIHALLTMALQSARDESYGGDYVLRGIMERLQLFPVPTDSTRVMTFLNHRQGSTIKDFIERGHFSLKETTKPTTTAADPLVERYHSFVSDRFPAFQQICEIYNNTGRQNFFDYSSFDFINFRQPDVVFVDPMHSLPNKYTIPNKNLVFLRQLAGISVPHETEELVSIAARTARHFAIFKHLKGSFFPSSLCSKKLKDHKKILRQGAATYIHIPSSAL